MEKILEIQLCICKILLCAQRVHAFHGCCGDYPAVCCCPVSDWDVSCSLGDAGSCLAASPQQLEPGCL